MVGGAGEAAAKAGLTGWMHGCYEVRGGWPHLHAACLLLRGSIHVPALFPFSVVLHSPAPPSSAALLSGVPVFAGGAALPAPAVPTVPAAPTSCPHPSQSLRGHGISTTLVKIKGGREETVAEAAEAFLLPFRLSPNCTPEELTVGSAEGDAAAATVSEDAQPLQPEAWQQSNAEHGEMKGACGGVVEATGARLLAGGRVGW